MKNQSGRPRFARCAFSRLALAAAVGAVVLGSGAVHGSTDNEPQPPTPPAARQWDVSEQRRARAPRGHPVTGDGILRRKRPTPRPRRAATAARAATWGRGRELPGSFCFQRAGGAGGNGGGTSGRWAQQSSRELGDDRHRQAQPRSAAMAAMGATAEHVRRSDRARAERAATAGRARHRRSPIAAARRDSRRSSRRSPKRPAATEEMEEPPAAPAATEARRAWEPSAPPRPARRFQRRRR